MGHEGRRWRGLRLGRADDRDCRQHHENSFMKMHMKHSFQDELYHFWAKDGALKLPQVPRKGSLPEERYSGYKQRI
jgi:hypothetical protein